MANNQKLDVGFVLHQFGRLQHLVEHKDAAALAVTSTNDPPTCRKAAPGKYQIEKLGLTQGSF
jgi:hypothetical protein